MSEEATQKDSIWGSGDQETLEFLKDEDFSGKWLNLAAGDGRYNSLLLRGTDTVVASDIDEKALRILWQGTPKDQRRKLEIKVLDMAKRFPFADHSFDGVFCTGVLHLFPREALSQIISEIDRVLKPEGKVILDFGADIQRVSSDGELVTFKGEPMYSMKEAKEVLGKLFERYIVRVKEGRLFEELQGADPSYSMSCNFFILIGKKPHNI